jgi:hypothetical protein
MAAEARERAQIGAAGHPAHTKLSHSSRACYWSSLGACCRPKSSHKAVPPAKALKPPSRTQIRQVFAWTSPFVVPLPFSGGRLDKARPTSKPRV